MIVTTNTNLNGPGSSTNTVMVPSGPYYNGRCTLKLWLGAITMWNASVHCQGLFKEVG